MKKNGILTLLFACIPGAGQMYQGYMKRGLSLITMFCLFIIVGSATGLDALVVGCIVVYMYSFFDTFNLRAQIIAENAPADDYLVHINWKDKRMQDFMMDSHKLLGWGLIALGAMVAYQNIIMRVLGDVMWRWGQNNPFFRAVYLMLEQLPQIVVCVALIVCGVWLVRGPKGRKQKPQNDAELPRVHRSRSRCTGSPGGNRRLCHAEAQRSAGRPGDPGGPRRAGTAGECGGRRWTNRIRQQRRSRKPGRKLQSCRTPPAAGWAA